MTNDLGQWQYNYNDNDNDTDDICKEQYLMECQKQSWIA